MKQPWTTRALLLGLLSVAVPPAAAAAPSAMLTKMECVAPQVEEVTSEEERFDITTTLLESYLVTGVKERIAGAPVEESCNNVLYLNVSMVQGENDAGSPLHYSTRVRLEVRRLANLVDNDRQGLVTVWDREAFVIGEKFEVQRTTLGTIGELIGALGADMKASGGL